MTSPAAHGVRIKWAQLLLGAGAIEDSCGPAITRARTQPGGFSPGLAARVLGATAARYFVKAVSARANPDTPGPGCVAAAGSGGGDQGGLDGGVQDRQAAGGAVQGPGDVGAVGVLGEVAACAGAEGGQDRGVIGIRGQDDDGYLRMLGGQRQGGLDSVDDGHVQ